MISDKTLSLNLLLTVIYFCIGVTTFILALVKGSIYNALSISVLTSCLFLNLRLILEEKKRRRNEQK